MKGRYLITTDNWFYAPDGKPYRAAWGDVTILEDNILGIKTNRNSVNWYAKIGSEEKHIIVAGCQINYAIKCNDIPYQGKVLEIAYEGIVQFDKLTQNLIYIAE